MLKDLTGHLEMWTDSPNQVARVCVCVHVPLIKSYSFRGIDK